jgi:Protein of unknown function (DUF2961)
MEPNSDQAWAAAGAPSDALGALANGPVYNTRVVSPENPDGSKGGAARAVPDPSDPDLVITTGAAELGVGWKVRPCIGLKSGQTVTLADIEGPGSINHMWIACTHNEWRGLVLRIYWDDEQEPSVECPLGDFFAIGHDGSPHQVSSMPIVVAPARGCNSYWHMPFRSRARLTLTNDSKEDVFQVFYKVLYREHPVAPTARYFHAQWRRSVTQRAAPEHVILDGVQGEGYYAGTYLAWTSLCSGWWGEGEVKFYLDGDDEFPTIADTGTEDYFGGAWCFYQADTATTRPSAPDGIIREEQTYSTPFLGLPLAEIRSGVGPRRFSLYRWHVLDPIGFHEDVRVTVQALGMRPDGTWKALEDDIASVAIWYQAEPHNPFPALLDLGDRRAR